MMRIHLRSLMAVASEIFWDGVIALLGRHDQPLQSDEERQSTEEQVRARTEWIRANRRQS